MRSPPRAALQDGFVLCQSRTKQFRLAPADCIEGNIQCPATQHALDSIIHAMPNQNNLHSRPPNSMVEAEPHATGRANLRFEFNIYILPPELSLESYEKAEASPHKNIKNQARANTLKKTQKPR